MVQDMFEPEFYSSARVVKSSEQGGVSSFVNTSFADVLTSTSGSDGAMGDDDVEEDGSMDFTKERLPLFCVPCPSESDWSHPGHHGPGVSSLLTDDDDDDSDPNRSSSKRTLNRADDDAGDTVITAAGSAAVAPTDSSTTKRLNTDDDRLEVAVASGAGHVAAAAAADGGGAVSVATKGRFPSGATTTSRQLCCLVKLYDQDATGSESSSGGTGTAGGGPGTGGAALKLNDVVEVVGILEADPAAGREFNINSNVNGSGSGGGSTLQHGDSGGGGGGGGAGSGCNAAAEMMTSVMNGAMAGGGGMMMGMVFDEEEAVARQPPSSKVPRLHCLLHRIVDPTTEVEEAYLATINSSSLNPMSTSNSHNPNRRLDLSTTTATTTAAAAVAATTTATAAATATVTRAAVLARLCSALGGDDLAAEFVLLSLCSKVHSRVDGSNPIGTFPLHLVLPPSALGSSSAIPTSAASSSSLISSSSSSLSSSTSLSSSSSPILRALSSALCDLMPRVATVPLNRESLETLLPKKVRHRVIRNHFAATSV
jgi:hypothetical protein